MRAQMLDGVEKLGLTLSRGGRGVAVGKRADVDTILLGIIPGKDLPARCSCFCGGGWH